MIRCLILVILVATAAPAAGAEDVTITGDGVTRILVTFADPAMSNAARAGAARPGYKRRSSAYLVSVGVKRAANRIARDFNLTTLDEWPIVSLKVHCLVFGVESSLDVDELLARLRQRPEVESAQRLNQFEVSATHAPGEADPYAGLQHNLDTLELTQAHHWSRGDGTRVAIIDTGADLEHPELRTRIASYHDFVEDGDGDFSADVHGTAVAGVIGADADNGVGITGVAPATHLSVLKACWHQADKPRALCDSFTLAKALDYAVGTPTDIINLSLNGPSDGLLRRLVEQTLAQGIVVVAAAPGQAQVGFPAEIAGVIVVAPDDESDASSGGSRTAIRAPGADILVPVPAGGYDFASGSSLSAAQVSGIVALLVARRPALTTEQIRALLVKSQAGVDQSVNACRALAELLDERGCREADYVSTTP